MAPLKKLNGSKTENLDELRARVRTAFKSRTIKISRKKVLEALKDEDHADSR